MSNLNYKEQTELASNLKYKDKYLKYKQKYLELKNQS
jgi:hypothetical protein